MHISLSKLPKLLGDMNYIHKWITDVRISTEGQNIHWRSEYPAYNDALLYSSNDVEFHYWRSFL